MGALGVRRNLADALICLLAINGILDRGRSPRFG